MNFTVINEPFQCGNCNAEVPILPGSCRNHCHQCLVSRHVDAKFPGDRASKCGALMPPIGVQHSGKKGWMIIHQCQKCDHSMKNKVADDDNMDRVIELSQRPQPGL